MPSQLKLLRESRSKGNFNLVDRKIKNKIRTSNSRRGGSRSPTNEDVDRIIEDYIDIHYLRNVINKKTSLNAVESLEEGNAKRGSASDFENFISSVGKENMADRIYNRYFESNVENLLKQKIKLKTKTIQGYKINKKSYLRRTIAGLRAFTFKTGRFAKLPKTFTRRKNYLN